MTVAERAHLDILVKCAIWNRELSLEDIAAEVNHTPTQVRSSLNRLMNTGQFGKRWQEFSSYRTGTWYDKNDVALPHWRYVYTRTK